MTPRYQSCVVQPAPKTFPNAVMSVIETIEREPLVLANRRGVAFSVVYRSLTVERVINIATLEAYFWLESRA